MGTSSVLCDTEVEPAVHVMTYASMRGEARSVQRGCVCATPTDCVEEVADVGPVSGGCDS